jgi:hypothetical protein
VYLTVSTRYKHLQWTSLVQPRIPPPRTLLLNVVGVWSRPQHEPCYTQPSFPLLSGNLPCWLHVIWTIGHTTPALKVYQLHWLQGMSQIFNIFVPLVAQHTSIYQPITVARWQIPHSKAFSSDIRITPMVTLFGTQLPDRWSPHDMFDLMKHSTGVSVRRGPISQHKYPLGRPLQTK